MAALEVWALALIVCTGMISAQTQTTTAPTADTSGASPADAASGPTDGPRMWRPRFLRGGPPADFGSEGPGKALVDAFLARVYPNGTPAEVTDLLSQRTPQAFRQAMDIVRQAAEAQGIELPGPFRGPPGPLAEALLARVYPNGVPAEVTDLIALGTPESRRQAMDIVRQAAEAQGIQLPGPFRGPPGPLADALLARVYPNGVPVEVTDLIAQGTFDALRQAMGIVRQDAEAQGIQIPGPFNGPAGGFDGPLKALTERFLARVYPNGTPAEVTDLLAQGTPEAFRQAKDIVRQAAEAQGIRLPRPFRGPAGPGGPGPLSGGLELLKDSLLARVYPNGVPADVTDLIALGTPESRRQAMDIVRQAAEAQGIQLPGPFRGPPGAGRPGRFPGLPGGLGGGPVEGGLLSRVYPDGVPAEVTSLLGQGTPEARRQAMQLVGQAARDRVTQRLAGSGLAGGVDPQGNGVQGGPFQRGFPRGPFRGGFQRPQFQRDGVFGGNAGSPADSGNGFLSRVVTGLRSLQQA